MAMPDPNDNRAVKQILVMGVCAICILVLVQVLIAALLLGRLQRTHEEIRDLSDRLERLEVDRGGIFPKVPPATKPTLRTPTQPSAGRKDVEPSARGTASAGRLAGLTERLNSLLKQDGAILDRTAVERTLAEFEQAAAAGGQDDQGALLLIAWAYRRLDRINLAADWLRRAGEIPADHFADQLLAGQILLALPGRQTEAEVALQIALQDSATRPAAARLLARFYLERHQPDLAALALRGLKAADDDVPLGVLTGEVAVEKGELESAVQLLSRIVEKAPQNSDARLWLGAARLRQNSVETALAHFTDAERTGAGRADITTWQGVAYLRLHRIEQALERFQRAVTLDSRYAPARAYLGIAMANTDRLGEAIGHLNEAATLDPDSAATFFALAVCYARSDQRDAAAAALRRAVHLDAGYAQTADKARIFEGLLDEGHIKDSPG